MQIIAFLLKWSEPEATPGDLEIFLIHCAQTLENKNNLKKPQHFLEGSSCGL